MSRTPLETVNPPSEDGSSRRSCASRPITQPAPSGARPNLWSEVEIDLTRGRRKSHMRSGIGPSSPSGTRSALRRRVGHSTLQGPSTPPPAWAADPEHAAVLRAHRVDRMIPIEDTVGEVEAGTIGAIGLSEVAPDTLRRAQAVHPIFSVLNLGYRGTRQF